MTRDELKDKLRPLVSLASPTDEFCREYLVPIMQDHLMGFGPHQIAEAMDTWNMAMADLLEELLRKKRSH